MNKVRLILFIVSLINLSNISAQKTLLKKIKFIDYYYENASPLSWDAIGDTAIKINLLYDYERNSINRQCTHFNFK
ncbi:MAG: hypothetical protein R3182_13380, partial [Draconibacterium sp.]|nr:hypothetical protein [Draconibacterium sp.]